MNYSQKLRNQGFPSALRCAGGGIWHTILTQRNFRIQLVVAGLASFLGIALRLDRLELAIIFLVIGMVLAAETFNSAVEVLVDMACDGEDPKARIVKDVSAGGVLLTALSASGVGLLIFLPRLL